MTKTFTHWNFLDFKGYEVDDKGNLKYIKRSDNNNNFMEEEKEIEQGEEIKDEPEESGEAVGEEVDEDEANIETPGPDQE